MLEGLVQHDHPLTLQHVLGRMRNIYGSSEVVTLTDDGVERATYADVTKRVDKLANALTDTLGVEPGDRVATFAWNTQRHLEVYLAAPCIGAVLHTLNLRLFEEQLTYIANHAKDKLVFVDSTVVPLLEKVAKRFETVEHFVVMGDGDHGDLPNALNYEEPPATRRASSTRTGRRSCTPSAPASRTRWACASPTACCRSCRCSTPTRGGSRTRPGSPAAT
jgi:fatty-acyl-CoA synthase